MKPVSCCLFLVIAGFLAISHARETSITPADCTNYDRACDSDVYNDRAEELEDGLQKWNGLQKRDETQKRDGLQKLDRAQTSKTKIRAMVLYTCRYMTMLDSKSG